MKRLFKEVKMKALIGALAVAALVAMFIVPASTLAQAEDWLVKLSLTTDPHIGTVPGAGYSFAFGARDGASEGYDGDEGDQIAPMDPIMGINAYFYYPDNPMYQRTLVTSVVGPEPTITWPLRVKSTGDPGATQATLTWDAADIGTVPGKYVTLELQDTAGNTLADMRTAGSYTFSLQSGVTKDFHIVAAEHTPPQVSGVQAQQTTDGSGIVDVTYDVFDNEETTVNIALEYWDGHTWHAAVAVAGDVGADVDTGTGKHATWDARTQLGEVFVAGARVRVTAQSTGGTDEAESGAFDLDAAPPTGYGPSTPADGATGVAVEPELISSSAWDDSAPVEYRFIVATDSAFTHGVQESDWQAETGWTPPASLENGTLYYWKVKARDARGNEGEWSSTFVLTTIFEFVYEFKAGWNMVSLPLRTEETSPAELFPGHVVIYGWNPVTLSYYVPAELITGQAYWVLYFSDTTVAIHGVPVEQYELVDAVAGWHLIGSLEVEAQVTVTAGSVYGLYYWWNPETLSYEATDTLVPGRGYWLLGFTSFTIEVEPRLL